MNAKIRKLSLVVMMLFALAAFTSSASANHSWGGYHWARTSNPFSLSLGNNLSSTWQPYLSTTSSDWSQSTVLDTVVVAGQAKGRCRPTTGRVEVCNGAYGSNGWLGLAQIWVSGLHITQGTVKVNDTYFSMSQYNTTAERNHVMCQEVGHTLGLDHQDTSGATLNTCMDYSQSTTSQHPNQHDYDELVIIYSHLDSVTTVGSNALNVPAEANGSFNAQSEWGQLIRNEGHSALYMRSFGGGHQMFTFVELAD